MGGLFVQPASREIGYPGADGINALMAWVPECTTSTLKQVSVDVDFRRLGTKILQY
jgi:hypothetical protein